MFSLNKKIIGYSGFIEFHLKKIFVLNMLRFVVTCGIIAFVSAQNYGPRSINNDPNVRKFLDNIFFCESREKLK